MEDNEKDKFIKETLQKDKIISSKAENIFDSIDYSKRNPEIKKSTWQGKILTMAAGFAVVVVSAGAAIYVNKDKLTDNYIVAEEKHTTEIKGQKITTSKNEEIEILSKEVEEDNFSVIKELEDEYVKVVLTSDNRVLIKLNEAFIKTINWKGNSDKYYEVEGIINKVKDIALEKGSAIMLLIEDGTVECVQIFNDENVQKNELYFYNQGKVEGLENIKEFKQNEEPIENSEETYSSVNAVREDGEEKEIEIGKYNNMDKSNYEKVKFDSQDGTKKYTIEAQDGKYVQASGWAGASNNVYYIYDDSLYHMELTDGKKTRIATGVDDIWIDESMENQIIAKAKEIGFVLHRKDQYIKICDWDVSKSPVIDVKENDDILLTLKKDKSITIEFKTDRLKKVIKEDNYFKENFIYNFYADNCCKVDEKTGRYYANADMIYLDKVGIDNKYGIAYATKNKVVTLDLYEYMKQDIKADFNVNAVYYCVDYEDNIKKLESDKGTITFDDGEKAKCGILKITLNDGTVEYSIIRADGLNKRGGELEDPDKTKTVFQDL